MSLDAFLKTAYDQGREQQEKAATVASFQKLPRELLIKIATGQVKLSDLCSPDCDGGDKTWISKFEGTELYQQAIELEQQDIQLEMEQAQARARERQERPASDAIYDQKDQLRIQKKLLELQLDQSQLQATAAAAGPAAGAAQAKPPVPEADAQGAGAVGNTAAASDGALGSVGKTAAELNALAASWATKAAGIKGKSKTAFTMPSAGQLQGMAGNALGAAKGAWGKLSPGIQRGVIGGAAAGGLQGAMSNAHDEKGFHPLKAIGGALGGAALGGAVGGGVSAAAGKLLPKAPVGAAG